ncbi:MAG TPA: hypothetical protein VK421_15890 [Pyrinomonadaceae bacterium]|nr:hypothetical protein [Pyrinomonadaceae bacterium]
MANSFNYFNYFTEIEDAFVRRRGKHLLLSPMDWALIESWKEMGVPLHVALRGVEQAFDSFEAKPRRRSVKSLLYCQEEVEAQFAEWRESQTGARAPDGDDSNGAGATPLAADAGAAGNAGGGDAAGEDARLPFPREIIAGHLKACRAEIVRARDARSGGGELGEALERAAARLEELERDFSAAARPDAEKLEAALGDLETLLDRAARSSVEAERLAARRREAEEQLKPYRARMKREVYEQTLDNLLSKYLREDCGLPRLSLFYL